MKIDILGAVRSHVSTMRDYSTGRYSIPDIGLFYGLPASAVVVAIYLKWGFDPEALNALLAAFAIFVGLLLNLLMLVFTFSFEGERPGMMAEKRRSLIRELHDNISYSILLSIALVVITIVEIAILKRTGDSNRYTGLIGTGILIFLTGNFVMTLLMVLKRINIILRYQIDKQSMRKSA